MPMSTFFVVFNVKNVGREIGTQKIWNAKQRKLLNGWTGCCIIGQTPIIHLRLLRQSKFKPGPGPWLLLSMVKRMYFGGLYAVG